MTITEVLDDLADLHLEDPQPTAGDIESLTEEECYLAAILMDRSGVDLAEFAFVDEMQPDSCFRSHPHQWPWWRDRSVRAVEQAARSVGKTHGLTVRACAFPFSYPDQEHVITAPEGSHLDNLTGRLESQILSCRLMREMVTAGRGGITHRPFEINWANGARTMTRKPQRSGIGLKGIHPVWLDIDEAQDLPDRAWREVPEVVRKEIDGHMWRVHGVSKGVRDQFWDITQDGSGWNVWRIPRMADPHWDPSPEARAQKLRDYNATSEEDPDFRRNVYGEHGQTANRIFVLARLMAGVDDDESSHYNIDEYYRVTVTDSDILSRSGQRDANIEESNETQLRALLEMLDFPESHKRYPVTWSGMDIGLVNDPSEILTFAEYHPDTAEKRRDKAAGIAVPLDGQSRIKLLSRISLLRVPEPLLSEVVLHIIGFYGPKAFSLDKGGEGQPIVQALRSKAGIGRFTVVEATEGEELRTAEEIGRAKESLTVIKGYDFGSKIITGFDEEKVAELGSNPPISEMVEKAAIRRNVKEYATDVLRSIVDNQRHLFPKDNDLLNQLNGQTWNYSQDPVDAYGQRRRQFSKGAFHALDGARMAVLGMVQDPIEALLATPEPGFEPTPTYFLGG